MVEYNYDHFTTPSTANISVQSVLEALPPS